MQRAESFIMAGAGALVGGVIGALVTFWLAGAGAPKLEKEAAAHEQAEEQAPADVEERVAELERAVSRLRGGTRRLVAPVASVAAGSPGAPGTPAPAVPAGDDGAASGDPVVDNPVFEAAVRDLVDRIEEERDSEREVERSERRRQWSEEWASELTSSLKLSDAQKTKVQEIATEFFEGLRELRGSDAGPRPSRDERRAKMSALRDQAETKLAEVLDGQQMSTYKGLEGEQRLGGRFGREFRRRDGDNR